MQTRPLSLIPLRPYFLNPRCKCLEWRPGCGPTGQVLIPPRLSACAIQPSAWFRFLYAAFSLYRLYRPRRKKGGMMGCATY